MNKLLLTILFVTLLPVACLAQHHTDLAWTASIDNGVTYNVYKAAGTCPATGIPSGAQQIATGLTTLSYSDTQVTAGATACYYVTAELNGIESAPSNTASATTPVGSPGVLTATAK